MRQMYLTSAHHGRYVCASSIQRTIFANPKIALWTPRKIFKGETRHRGWLRPPSKLPLMRRSRGGTIECAGVFDTGLDVQAKNAVVRAVTTVGTMCIPHLRSRYLPARATGCLSGLRTVGIYELLPKGIFLLCHKNTPSGLPKKGIQGGILHSRESQIPSVRNSPLKNPLLGDLRSRWDYRMCGSV